MKQTRRTLVRPTPGTTVLIASHLPNFALCAAALLILLFPRSEAATYSLADDFSYTDNRANSTWSYRLDDLPNQPPAFPLLTAKRDANALWGSTFATPPVMWCEEAGYWGIGKNLTGQEQVSLPNGTRWAPGEILFHPKAGAAPSGLVVCWTAPGRRVIDVQYAFGRAATQGNGIGYGILLRRGGRDLPMVALDNIGGSLTNELGGIAVAPGDQLLFRFNTCGDPGGDISRAAIIIQDQPGPASAPISLQPASATLVTGSDFTFTLSAPAKTVQWRKDGQPIPGATNATFALSDLELTDAGLYSVVADATAGPDARVNVIKRPPTSEPYASLTPREVFSSTLAEQEQELKTNVLMLRFAESRKRLAADRYRPLYHFVSPESQLNDPNGLCFWQGRWHLFYQAYPPDEFPSPADIFKRRQHWGHAVSDDLVHWRDLPYAIYPGVERMCFSGSTVVEEDRVVAFYPGIAAGQMVAIASDPLLLNWEKLRGRPVNCAASGDSCIWKEGDTYLGLIGRGLWTSTDLVNWVGRGEFFSGVEGSCPNFVPIGNKHMVLSFSHSLGGQYQIGTYDPANRRFQSEHHGRFNHGVVSPGGVHAPSAASDGRGGVINILNINDGKHSDEWDQIMSLAQRLTLGPDNRLRIEPVPAIARLREHHQHVGETILPANRDLVLDGIRGDAMELDVEIDPQLARWVQLNVLRSPNAEEQTSITFYNFNRKLSIWYDTSAVICLDPVRSSTNPEVWIRPPERTIVDYGTRDWGSAPIATTPGKPVNLRVFIDRSVVEVFVNQKHYLALRVYPDRTDSVGVSLRAQGQAAVLKKLDAWQMKSIWPAETR